MSKNSGKISSKLIALFTSLVLVVGLMPLPAFADTVPAEEAGGLAPGAASGISGEDAGQGAERGMTAAAVVASGICGNGLTWTLRGGTLTISKTGEGDGKMTDYEWIDGSPGTINSPWFNSNDIKQVVIGDGVTSIGAYAFHSCANLTSVTIPSSVTAIGVAAFNQCESLRSAEIPGSVKSIGNSAFRGTCFKSVTIPYGVESIGERAFDTSLALQSVTIPPTVESIGQYAFAVARTLDVRFGGSEAQWARISAPEGAQDRFSEGAKLKYVCGEDLPWTLSGEGDNLTLIITGTGAMYDYDEQKYPAPWNSSSSSITSVVIGDDVTSIGKSAFEDLVNLASVTIPDGVTSIGTSAFAGCRSLGAIAYGGSQSQWGGVSKADGWDTNTPEGKTITFAKSDVTASASPEAGGTVTGGGVYAKSPEATATLTASPNPGYVFVNWTEDDGTGNTAVVGTDATYEFTAEDNRTLVANFAEAYPLWVGGTQVTGANMDDILGDGTASFAPSADGGFGTLALDGAKITGSHEFEIPDGTSTAGICVDGEVLGLTVSLSGANEVSGADFGIYCFGDLTIEGEGSLTVDGGTCGIYGVSYGGTLAIDGTDVTATSKAGTMGICSGSGDIVITGSSVRAEGSLYGIYATNCGIVITDSAVEAKGKYNGIGSYGSGSLGGRVTIKDTDGSTRVDATGESYAGVLATVKLSLSGVDVVAPEGGASNGYVVKDAEGEIAPHVVIAPTFAVSFVDEDGTVLQGGKVAYGETPKYEGATPAKKADAQNAYTFAGWTPEVAKVTGDATYKATYASTVNKYAVKFVDEDGTVLQDGQVAYGETPKYEGATPAKAADDKYTYTFAGWTPEVAKVTGDATYTATYDKKEKPSVEDVSRYAGYVDSIKATMPDLDPNSWYMGGDGTRGGYFPGTDVLYLDYTLARGLMSGYTDENGKVYAFGPNDPLKRAEAVTVLYRMANRDATATTDPAKYEANRSGLADVEDRAYYTAAVNWAVESGIVTGYTDESGKPYAFGPDDPLLREQVATVTWRWCTSEAVGMAQPTEKASEIYDDAAAISEWALLGVAFCHENGIMTGFGGTRNFGPVAVTERCEMSKVVAVADRLVRIKLAGVAVQSVFGS